MVQGVEDPRWFLVYLVIELVVAPHSRRFLYARDMGCLPTENSRSRGLKSPSSESLAKSQQKTRRGSKSRLLESVELVHEYIACMDEISQIHDIFGHELDFLKQPAPHCWKMDTPLAETGSIGPSTSPSKETLIHRVDDAIAIRQEPLDQLPRLSKDLTSSLIVVRLSGSEIIVTPIPGPANLPPSLFSSKPSNRTKLPY